MFIYVQNVFEVAAKSKILNFFDKTVLRDYKGEGPYK